MTPNPVSPYGETKLAMERMLLAYERAYGFVRSRCATSMRQAPTWKRNGEDVGRSRLIARALESGSRPLFRASDLWKQLSDARWNSCP
jgi:nucleoside-diphosphate-sugar epimerase